MERHVNTSSVGLLYYPFCWWAKTPTTLRPKTRLKSTSIKPFYLHQSGCLSVWSSCIQKNRGTLCDHRGGVRVSASMQTFSCIIASPTLLHRRPFIQGGLEQWSAERRFFISVRPKASFPSKPTCNLLLNC